MPVADYLKEIKITSVGTSGEPDFREKRRSAEVVFMVRDSRYFGFLLRSKHATRRAKSEREEVSIEQTR